MQKSINRREALQTAVAMSVGAVAGCAAPGTASTAPKSPFAVPATYITIAGSDLKFQVRRIYCIGRNYAAHAREMGSDPNREPPFSFRSRRMRSRTSLPARSRTTPTRR